MSIEAMKQALEALALIVAVEWTPAFTRKEYDSDEPEENEMRDRVLTAITALRTAIEQAEKQEPVAHIPADALKQLRPPMLILRDVPMYGYAAEGTVSVYTTPPAAQRQWVGLTNEEMQSVDDIAFTGTGMRVMRAIEAKLREKNGGQA